MNDINGFDNEFAFVLELNNKRIKDLTPICRDLIETIFPYENEESIIKCWRNHLQQKSDILVKINNKMKGISIKKGIRNSVHVEPISDFIHFLIENKVSKETVIEYLKFHYADGSTNGKGISRISTEEYKINNQAKIDKINKEINNRKLLIKAINRFIIRGNNSIYPISALIYGEVDDFVFITREDIINIILSKIDEYSSTVHFSVLTVQPKNRCLNYNPKYEKDRYCVQVKWYSVFDDIIENMYLKEEKLRKGMWSFQADHEVQKN